MIPPSHGRGRQDQSTFQAWARSDGWIELQPVMVEQRARGLVIDCIVGSVRFGDREPVGGLGEPAVLALECPGTTIEAAIATLHRVMDISGSLHLFRDADDGAVIMLVGVEVWVLNPPRSPSDRRR